MTVMITDIIRRCNWHIGRSLEAIDEFRQGLDNDMVHALKWSEQYFMYAAEYQVYVSIRDWAESVRTEAENGRVADMDDAIAKCKVARTKRLLDLCRDKGQSTNATANIMDNYIRIVWARVVVEEGFWK